jgi:diguanylate cyclase (GGDEF)-like protein
MTSGPKFALLASLALAGISGSVLGVRALSNAVTRCRNLYRVDTSGSQIESELEFQTQESRRAFLYALAIKDPNEQLPFIDQSRTAGKQVQDAVRRLRQIGAPEIAGWMNGFETSWKKYEGARDVIVAAILEGDPGAAMAADRSRGEPSFQTALQSLHVLKSMLAQHASDESEQVNTTLRLSGAGLGAFAICTTLIVLLLLHSNRERDRILEALAGEREMERQRSAILEMVSTHAPMSRSLGSIVNLAPMITAGAGAAVWAASGDELLFQVAANLPKKLTDGLAQHPLARTEQTHAQLAEGDSQVSALARRLGFQNVTSRQLHDAGGTLIGMLQVFVSEASLALSEAVLNQVAQLASVAIDNTLLYERLAFQAQHDALTGLPNRMLFQERLQQALRLARRQERKAAVLWLDLDRYNQQINDTLGHSAGDEALHEIARRLKACLRASDTVARAGGDEFTILVQDLGDAADAELVCLKILSAISQPMKLGEREVIMTASAGVSIFPDHGDDPVALLRNADLAMHTAKRAGGNTHQMFRTALGASIQRRLKIQEQLHSALQHQEFHLEYQPIVNRDGKIESVEALLRWPSPLLGPVSPADFIPIAEEMGIIPAIGEWVTRTACTDVADWLRAGHRIQRVAVNLSAAQFVGEGCAPMVERALRDSQLSPNRLELEITETALMNNLDLALEQIETLRVLGVRFAIDDFGTGYSSLSQLRNLPVDCIKIDRSFIKDLDRSGSGSTMVRGIIGLAHNLKLDVVAEGVETEEQLRLIRALGCDLSQGFFLHRPMPREAVEKLFRENAIQADLDAVDRLAGSELVLQSTA